jgi:hypothetical protein
MTAIRISVVALFATFCATAPAYAATSQASNTIFYSGGGHAGEDSGNDAGAWVMVEKPFKDYEVWAGTSPCNSNRAVPRRTNRTFTRLVGYSLGRLGPAYYLQQMEQRHTSSAVRSVILLDPGAASEFTCDNRSGAGYTYATWLRQNPANRLLIINGAATAADNYGGLRDTYLSKLTAQTVGANVGDRVLVCDVPSIKHSQMDEAWKHLIPAATQTSCPPSTTRSPYSPKSEPGEAPAPAPGSDPSTPGPGGGPPQGGGGAPPPSPPPTWSETTGGETHTWTNYTNAGGYEGQTIPSNTTVQIACKLQGFRVEDGNTWWYRIASDPWNGNYYASADAFYNNGQTSGSLHGTPYVDTNVRDC